MENEQAQFQWRFFMNGGLAIPRDQPKRLIGTEKGSSLKQITGVVGLKLRGLSFKVSLHIL